jgi:hypothetical protein
MKITQFDFDYLKKAMEEVRDKIPAHIEFLNKPENKIKIKDFDTRLRWDWFTAAIRGRTSFLNKLYDYLDDTHINTALKQIVKEIS